MLKQDKIFAVEDITAKIKDARAVALADYRGITVSQATQLRDKIKSSGGKLQVIKNTLFLRALKNNNYEVEREKLDGPTVVLFANDDEVSPLKTLASFAKATEGLLPWKIGFMDGKILSAEELGELAGISSKADLQAKLVSLLFSQPRRLVYALNFNLQKLVLVLNSIKEVSNKNGKN